MNALVWLRKLIVKHGMGITLPYETGRKSAFIQVFTATREKWIGSTQEYTKILSSSLPKETSMKENRILQSNCISFYRGYNKNEIVRNLF